MPYIPATDSVSIQSPRPQILTWYTYGTVFVLLRGKTSSCSEEAASVPQLGKQDDQLLTVSTKTSSNY